jgi:hypothetical protein
LISNIGDKKMIKRYVVVFLCMCIISFPITSGTIGFPIVRCDCVEDPNSGVKDQRQEQGDNEIQIKSRASQEFVPSGKKQMRVEVKIRAGLGDNPPITLQIEKPLGTILAYKELPASAIPSTTADWVSFDINDISLTQGEKYYIVLSFSVGGLYFWCGDSGDPYPAGISSRGDKWDWCFRTYVSRSKIHKYEDNTFDKIVEVLTTILFQKNWRLLHYDIHVLKNNDPLMIIEDRELEKT